MKFTVIWKPTADEQLAEIWLTAEDRTAVTVAADELMAGLREAPLTLGESRDSLRRVAIRSPLAIHFEVQEADRLVFVLRVHRVTTRQI